MPADDTFVRPTTTPPSAVSSAASSTKPKADAMAWLTEEEKKVGARPSLGDGEPCTRSARDSSASQPPARASSVAQGDFSEESVRQSGGSASSSLSASMREDTDDSTRADKFELELPKTEEEAERSRKSTLTRQLSMADRDIDAALAVVRHTAQPVWLGSGEEAEPAEHFILQCLLQL